MPHYDYQCTKCGYTFETFQKINDKPLTNCPECKGKLKRLIGAGCGLIFKGSGFYITDYKKNNKKQDTNNSKDPSNELKNSSKKEEKKNS